MAKARVLAGSEVDERQALDVIDDQQIGWGDMGAVEAPYDPESLLAYIELTPHLTPNLDAYAQNIEGYGFHSEPVEPWMKDLDGEEATKAIRDAIVIEQWVTSEEEHLGEGDDYETNPEAKALDRRKLDRRRRGCRKADGVDTLTPQVTPSPAVPTAPGDTGGRPTDDQSPGMPEETPSQTAGDIGVEISDVEVNERREEIRQRLQREQYLFDAWFRNCVSDSSFVQLRRKFRWDIEAHGWGCVEMIRDAYGRLKRLAYVPGYTVRPLVDEGDAVEVVEDDSVTPLSEGREVKVWRKFRRFIQQVGSKYVYFKSPGDPRVVSGASGKIYLDEQEAGVNAEDLFSKEEPEAKQANELLYIALHSPKTPCPPPRWIGNLLAVLGVRESDEMNYNYFGNRSIPPAIVFVSGGRLPKDVRERLEGRIANEIKGVDNAHKILVVEAIQGSPRGTAPGERTQLAQMTYQQLTDAHTDATFKEYDVRSADRIGASFRLSPILRGLTPSTLNRATAEAALYQAEQQVFQPERENVDWLINKILMPELGIKFLRFVSNTPPTSAPETLISLISAAGPTGGLTPNEIRDVASLVLNKALGSIDEDWAKQPLAITLAGQGGGGQFGASSDRAVGTNDEVLSRLRAIETKMEAIIGEELRLAGYDAQVRAHFLDTPQAAVAPTGGSDAR
jgi:capsid portal protein